MLTDDRLDMSRAVVRLDSSAQSRPFSDISDRLVTSYVYCIELNSTKPYLSWEYPWPRSAWSECAPVHNIELRLYSIGF